MPVLVLTRPEPAARRFARAARASGWPGAILFSPVLRILPVPGGPLPAGTLVFTSENGVLGAARRGSLAGRDAWAVGDRTARAAGAAGVRVRSAAGDMEGLAEALLAEGAGPYIHARGRHVSGDLAGRLAAAGLEVAEAVVYDQEACALTAAARAALAGQDRTILPLFSPRSARLTAEGLPGPPPATTIVAMSPAVAAAWRWSGTCPDGIVTADRPESGAILTLVRGLVGGACRR